MFFTSRKMFFTFYNMFFTSINGKSKVIFTFKQQLTKNLLNLWFI